MVILGNNTLVITTLEDLACLNLLNWSNPNIRVRLRTLLKTKISGNSNCFSLLFKRSLAVAGPTMLNLRFS